MTWIGFLKPPVLRIRFHEHTLPRDFLGYYYFTLCCQSNSDVVQISVALLDINVMHLICSLVRNISQSHLDDWILFDLNKINFFVGTTLASVISIWFIRYACPIMLRMLQYRVHDAPMQSTCSIVWMLLVEHMHNIHCTSWASGGGTLGCNSTPWKL